MDNIIVTNKSQDLKKIILSFLNLIDNTLSNFPEKNQWMKNLRVKVESIGNKLFPNGELKKTF